MHSLMAGFGFIHTVSIYEEYLICSINFYFIYIFKSARANNVLIFILDYVWAIEIQC